MSGERQSIGVQAARFSLYAPFVAIGIGLFTLAGRKDQSGALTIALINMTLIVIGFCAGIFALISMAKFGRKGILWRSIAGVVLNGIVILSLAATMLIAASASKARTQVVGHWRMQPSPNVASNIDFTFNPDGTFKFESTARSGNTIVADGQWVMTASNVIGLTIEHAPNGGPSAVGQKTGLGAVKSIDDTTMVLSTDSGEETYHRVQ